MINYSKYIKDEIIKMIEVARNNKIEMFKDIIPNYLLEIMTSNNDYLKNKLKILTVVINDCDTLELIIKNIKFEKINDELLPYINSYGLLSTRNKMYYNDDFLSLSLKDQVNIFLVELFNSYSECGKPYESFLALCHFGFFNEKPIYGLSNRSKLINIMIEKGVKLPILFERTLSTKKFMEQNDFYERDKMGKTIYYKVNQSGGWGITNVNEKLNEYLQKF